MRITNVDKVKPTISVHSKQNLSQWCGECMDEFWITAVESIETEINADLQSENIPKYEYALYKGYKLYHVYVFHHLCFQERVLHRGTIKKNILSLP